MKTKSVFSVHKLGVARGQERSRVWLEGKRLIEFGFGHYKDFSATFGANRLELNVMRSRTEANQVTAGNLYRVAGAVERPIIDIVGERVRDTFKGFDHVSVKWEQGKIAMIGCKKLVK